MKTILEATLTAKKLCSVQKRCPGEEYRLTRYCVTLPFDEGTLVYNTLTGALILLDREESLADHEEALIAARFLVPESFDEKNYVRQLRSVARMLNTMRAKRSFSVLTTTDCNARCYYCYEMGAPRLSMTSQTAHDLARYIAEKSKGGSVRFHWFGGEPLYNSEVIDVITGDLRERTISFDAEMITNAYYLDKTMARKAKDDWHIDWIQVTLDGTREVYNRTKAYVDRDGDHFDRVLDNISNALDVGIRVLIRLNMSRDNADDLFALADVLGARFGGRRGVQTYVALLHEFVGRVNRFETKTAAAERCRALNAKLEELGLVDLPDLKRDFRIYACMADSNETDVIFPDGKLIVCDHYSESAVIGSIYDGVTDRETVQAWKETLEYPECADCALYPRCIYLKNCKWVEDSCNEFDRSKAISTLKKQILAAYRKELDKNNTEGYA